MSNNESQTLEVEGEWWLPELDDKKVFGTLRFDPDSGGSLRLIGTLGGGFASGEPEASVVQSGTYPRILGRAGAGFFTLEDCFQSRYTWNSQGGVETVTVNQILEGAHFGRDEPLVGDRVSVDLRYLTHWIGTSGIGETHTISDEVPTTDAPLFKLEGRHPSGFEDIALSDGTIVRIVHVIGVKGDGVTSRGLTQRFYFRVDAPEVEPIEDLVERASDLQDLVSIAVNRTAEIGNMRFWHPELVARINTSEHRLPVRFYVRWNARDASTSAKMSPSKMMFTYSEFGGREGVRRWLESAARHQGALGRVMATRYAKGMFVSDRLLNRAAALEAFDRVVSGYSQSKFATRLRRCSVLAGDPFRTLVGDIETWVEAVKRDRDDVAHHIGTRVKQSSSAQLFLADSLYWLFVLCLLRDAQAPNEVFDRIQGHAELKWLGPRLRDALHTP